MKSLKLLSFTIGLTIVALNMNGQTRDCQASFSVILDSLTSAPYNYHFKDLSSGNINKWSWDFGDGFTSAEQHPSHQFAEPGTYQVCLTVADQNDISNCFDEECQDIITIDYYSLGGLVYAGEYPLNNPVFAGDTGIASLYRIVNNQVVFVEDQYFQDYGYYWFGYLFPGDYIIKIGLTEGSTHYNDYFTTYFGDATSWTKAGLLTVTSSDQYAADIHLERVSDLAPGPGIIRGYVNFEQGNVYSMPPVSQTSVILADQDHNPLIYTHPNSSGYFEFTGIPFDSYYLSADATGKPSSAVNIIISESVPLVEGINLTIFGSNVNFIPEGSENSVFLLKLYPNPIKDVLHLSLYSAIAAPVGIRVIDVTGKSFYSNTGKFETGFSEILIPVSSLPKGIYLLILQPRGSYLPVTAKFVK